jgi:hypothetical protein
MRFKKKKGPTMKKIIALIALIACTASAQQYLNLTGAELNSRLASVTNLQAKLTVAEANISNSVSNISFVRSTITTNFAATDWTAINLSAITGANHALVIVRALNNTTTARSLTLRNPDDSGTFGIADGIGSATIDASGMAYLAVVTGSTGIIEGTVSAGSFTLTAVAVIKRNVFD